MHAHRTIHIGVFLRKPTHSGRIFHADANTEKMTNTTGAGGIQHRIEIVRKRGQIKAIKMAM